MSTISTRYATLDDVDADLFVSLDARGAGAGRALMLAAETHARNAGVARMDLSTARNNTVAQSLYESFGWVRDEIFFVYNKLLRG